MWLIYLFQIVFELRNLTLLGRGGAESARPFFRWLFLHEKGVWRPKISWLFLIHYELSENQKKMFFFASSDVRFCYNTHNDEHKMHILRLKRMSQHQLSKMHGRVKFCREFLQKLIGLKKWCRENLPTWSQGLQHFSSHLFEWSFFVKKVNPNQIFTLS